MDNLLVYMKSSLRQHPALTGIYHQLKEWGYKVSLRKHAFISRKNVAGWHNRHVKTVCVSVFDKDDCPRDLGDLVFVLAHEYRHAWQLKNKQYRRYMMRRGKLKARDFLSFMRAERDAQEFARKFCLRHGITHSFGVYPYSKMYKLAARKEDAARAKSC
jgi:hypothetical protein